MKMPRYIDADKLLARYKERCAGCKETQNYCEHCCDLADVIDDIEDAPTADAVERKRGRWIKNDFYEDALMCSCCHAYLDKEDWSRHYFYFCYHCGAFMEGMDCGADNREEKADG